MSSSPRLPLRRSIAVFGLVAAFAIGACSASRPTGAPPAVPTSKAYHQSDAKCRQVAARETENVSPQSQASKAAITIYWRCMTAQGFPPPGSSPAPAATPLAP